MAKKTIITDPDPKIASFVTLPRTVPIGGVGILVDVETEYLDKKKADVEAFAEACTVPGDIRLSLDVAERAGDEKGALCDTAIYLIGPRNAKVTKIGIASNPGARLRGLQVANHEELFIHGLFWIMEGSAQGIEQLSLRVAAKMGKRIRGEWVSLAPEGAAYIVASVIHSANVKAASSAMWIRNRQALRVAKVREVGRVGDELSCIPTMADARGRFRRIELFP